MSDNEDLLGDDLGDQSLADYNLGNEEEEQLLADDYENAGPQNVPSSLGPAYREPIDNMVPQPQEYAVMDYGNQPISYQRPIMDTECVVPNITVEVPNTRPHATYAPYEPPVFEEHAVPPPIPAAPVESPQIVPSDIMPPVPNGAVGGVCDLGPRERFISERPTGAQRMPQVRDIPDTLDKVVIPRGVHTSWSRGAARVWRNNNYVHRHAQVHAHAHPYRRNHVHRNNFNQRPSLPPQQIRPNPPPVRPEIRPEIRPEMRPEIRPDIQPDMRPEMPQELRPNIPEPHIPPQMGPEISPERPILSEMPIYRPPMERPYFQRFQYRPEERPQFGPRPNFDARFFRPNFPPRPFPPNIREMPPNAPQMQVTIRQPLPGMSGPGLDKIEHKGELPREPEVRMLPVGLPANLPPGGLTGKKVLINPHFKGTFQPPVEGPVKDIDDAAERFIAEQRNALARAAVRKQQARRSPQRYIENTTIEIENELAHPHSQYSRTDDDDLLRRQEEFINANRAGLRRRMRSPSPPPRRSPSPRRSPERRPRTDEDRHHDEDSEYKRRLREQENLRERVLRAKEVRRRKNAVALHKQLQENPIKPPPTTRERDIQEKPAPKPSTPAETTDKPTSTEPENKPDTTRSSPEVVKEKSVAPVVRDRSPVKEQPQVYSTVENLTPPHRLPVKQESPERALTPPLPEKRDDKRMDSDDDLDLILGDIDGILSDDDDSGRFKEKNKKVEQQSSKSKPQVDLRSKLPPKTNSSTDRKTQRQKIIFNEDKKKKDKSPPRRAVVSSSTKTEDTDDVNDSKKTKTKPKLDNITIKSRQRIIYNHKEDEKDIEDKKSFSNRRVILQRKVTKEKPAFNRIEIKSDPTKPNPGIFSRAVRTAIGGDSSRIVIKKDEPQIQYESDSELDEDHLLEDITGSIATVVNLPHGMTDTRLKTLAGNDVQSLILDKEDRTAKITFKTTNAAETFKKKFNNKMVAASRLTVTLR